MKIGWKLAISQLYMMIILVICVALAIVFIALPKIETLEQEQRFAELERTKNRLNNELQRLSLVASDWGEWDDTYDYSINRTAEFVDSNFTDEVLKQVDSDLIVLIDKQGDVIWKQVSDDAALLYTDPQLVSENWSSNHSLVRSFNDRSSSFFVTNAGGLMLASHPILTSEGFGPEQGRIYFGKLINQAFVDSIADDLRLPVTLEVKKTSEVALQNTVEFMTDNSSHVQGIISFDNSNDYVINISIIQNRPFYQQALSGAKYSLGIITLIGLLSCLITLFVQRKLIIKPVLSLRDQSIEYANSNNPKVFKPLNNTDELAELTFAFRDMAKMLSKTWNQLEADRSVFEQASLTDSLTQLKNRRYLKQFLENRDNIQNHQNWLCIMVDIDHFKVVNDTLGHDVGDMVLKQIATLLTKLSRSEDIVVRMGGEEFAILCSSTDIEHAQSICERIRVSVSNFSFGRSDSTIRLTCSLGFFGITNSDPDRLMKYWGTILKVADLALYAAKHNGRNCWVGLMNNGLVSDSLDSIQKGSAVKELIEKQKLLQLSSLPKDQEIIWL